MKSVLKYFTVFFLINFLFFYNAKAIIIQSGEVNSLKKGNIIQQSVNYELRKSLKGLESKILIDAPPAKVWNVIENKENLPKFIRQIKSTKIIEENKSVEKVSANVKICQFLPNFKYILVFDNSEKYKKIKFKKTGGAFKELFGYFELIPYGNKTIFAYRIFSDPGFYIPRIANNSMRKDAIEIMKSIKREAEK